MAFGIIVSILLRRNCAYTVRESRIFFLELQVRCPVPVSVSSIVGWY